MIIITAERILSTYELRSILDEPSARVVGLVRTCASNIIARIALVVRPFAAASIKDRPIRRYVDFERAAFENPWYRARSPDRPVGNLVLGDDMLPSTHRKSWLWPITPHSQEIILLSRSPY